MSLLLEDVRRAIKARHYSPKTSEAYTRWIRRFILYHGKRHPKDLGGPEVSAFLSYLATDHGVATSTQGQALSASCSCTRKSWTLNCPGWTTSCAPSRPFACPRF